MYLVVISTAGNQRYIFSSGKRQEIVGASDLITRVDGVWAEEALEQAFRGFEKREWRIGSHDAELLVAGAGGITVLVRDKAAGRRLVTELTRRALEHAPGLDVCGVMVECIQGSLAATIRRARTELAAVREIRPGPQARFLRLPPVEACASGGLPAAGVRREGEGEPPQPRSASALAKLAAYPAALDRMAGLAGTDRPSMRRIVDRLGLEAEWVAVVHADGNGLGEIFQKLAESAADADDSDYADALRGFSLGVDGCAKKAFEVALRRTAVDLGDGKIGSSALPVPPINSGTTSGALPVLPLVLGGDDLTVVCEGGVALPFTRHYLEAFEEITGGDPALKPMLAKLGRRSLSAAAGVAIVKRNYPFHFAYELAEELTTVEAKGVKSWSSALAFVVLMESSAPDLERIRHSATLSGGSAGSASPYLVGEGSRDPRARGRRWEDLVRRVAALNRRDPLSKELLIPRGAAHDLREGLCLGGAVAASRLDLLRRRFQGDEARTRALKDLTGEPGGSGGDDEALADPTEEPGGLASADRQNEERTVTGLPDAMAAMSFLPAGEGAR